MESTVKSTMTRCEDSSLVTHLEFMSDNRMKSVEVENMYFLFVCFFNFVAEEFHLLSRALEILTDAAAKVRFPQCIETSS